MEETAYDDRSLEAWGLTFPGARAGHLLDVLRPAKTKR